MKIVHFKANGLNSIFICIKGITFCIVCIKAISFKSIQY